VFDFCLCVDIECKKSNECYRFLNKSSGNPIYIKFHNICSESGGYRWFWQAPNELIKKEKEDVGDI